MHLRVGWSLLLLSVTFGIVLESLHGFKVAWYVSVGDPETRRLMWRLAHAHGSFLSLINVAFALTVVHLPAWSERTRTFTSRCLIGASVLIPLGFFLGGTVVYAGDPGWGIVLLPLGALLLLLTVLLIACGTQRMELKTNETPASEGKADEPVIPASNS